MVGNKFQDIILKYSRDKSGAGIPDRFDISAEEVNPLCGDEITVYLSRHDDSLNISYHMRGCALCSASASIMVDTVGQKTEGDAGLFVSRFLAAFPKGETINDLGAGIEALFDMKRFPARERCVLLPWQALKKCLS